MNDRSPSGPSTPSDTSYDASFPGYPPGYEGFDGAYSMTQEQPYGSGVGYTNDTSYTDDPLFGAMPGQDHVPHAPTGIAEGGYGSGGYDTGGFASNDPWNSGSYPTANIPAQPDHQWAAEPTIATEQWDVGPHQPSYGEYDAYGVQGTHDGYDGYGTFQGDAVQAAPDYYAAHGGDSGTYPHVGQHAYDYNGSWDTGSYRLGLSTTTVGTGTLDESAWGNGGWTVAPLGTDQHSTDQHSTDQFRTGQYDSNQYDSGQLHLGQYDSGQFDLGQYDPGVSDTTASTAEQPMPNGHLLDSQHPLNPHDGHDPLGDTTDLGPGVADHIQSDVHGDLDSDFYSDLKSDASLDALAAPDASPAGAPLAGGGRGRRRAAKPRRSALLTVAVPSVAVMGVAGIAAASVSVVGEDEEKGSQAAPDPTSVKPSAANSKLDTQLEGVSADAGAFAGRASRAQERIDLKERQEAERKRKEAEAARKEAERPKFALPVDQPGLSAYYGQAGINWMSLHTGIDFPVSYGVPVKAVTDGVVSTKYDLSYGNMVIVTAADGTETWYCHMSSAKIRGGEVKAGDTIGYSGNSGNSTGPHLHFEVRPGGGSAVDPLAWFRGKGLDPT